MAFFEGWFGDYLDGWFDTPSSGPAPAPSANGGVSKARALSVVAPRPVVPPWRQIAGSVGNSITEIRNFLNNVVGQDHLWGNHVDVQFVAGTTPTKIATGLGGPAKAYKVVRSNADVRVWDATPGTPDDERGVLWLQASAPAKVTLYIY